MPDDTKTMRRPDAPELTKAWETTCTALLDGHQQALTQWLQSIQSVSDEMAQLAEARLQLAMEAWSALAACRGPEELIDWNKRVTTRMANHCSAEITKLSQMAMRVAFRPADRDAHPPA
jgi:hypothetical protein